MTRQVRSGPGALRRPSRAYDVVTNEAAESVWAVIYIILFLYRIAINLGNNKEGPDSLTSPTSKQLLFTVRLYHFNWTKPFAHFVYKLSENIYLTRILAALADNPRINGLIMPGLWEVRWGGGHWSCGRLAAKDGRRAGRRRLLVHRDVIILSSRGGSTKKTWLRRNYWFKNDLLFWEIAKG